LLSPHRAAVNRVELPSSGQARFLCQIGAIWKGRARAAKNDESPRGACVLGRHDFPDGCPDLLPARIGFVVFGADETVKLPDI
jgi:hypothetical protein